MDIRDKIEYIIIVVGEFARINKMSMHAAYRYIKNYGGMEIIDDGYDVEHTFSIDDAVADVTNYCKRNGGSIA